MIKPQYVYLAIDFIFERGTPKSKYFVVFHSDDEDILLFSLTTTKSKLPASITANDVEGCIQFSDDRGYGHAFVWKAGCVVGTNEWAFREQTYVQLEFRSHLKEIATASISELATKKIVEKCCLTDSTFCDLLRCLLQSKFLKQKHRRGIEKRINELS